MALVTISVCLVTAFFTYRAFNDSMLRDRFMFRPDRILAHKEWYRLFSSALIHGDWMHCGFNLLSFYLFAATMEYRFGGAIMLLIYLASILGGGLLSLYIHRHHDYQALGASGGVCGIIFASIFMAPGTSIGMLFIPIFIPGWLYAVLYLVGSFVGARKGTGNVGHDAHFGGAVTGLLAALIFAPQACLGHPIAYFGALILALAGLAVFAFDPLGLMRITVPWRAEAHRPNIRYQRYDEAAERNARKAELDRLLDRIAEKGMSGISARERQRLEELSATLPRR